MKNSNFVHLHNHLSFCLHGDTVIYNCISHHRNRRIYRKDYTRLNTSKTIRELYNLLTFSGPKGGTTKYQVKVFDGEIFVPSKIKHIYKTENPIQFYELTSEDGKKIKASENHIFFTLGGWKKLKDLKIGDYLGCNGIPVYQDYDWLKKKYLEDGLNQQQIADEIGVGRHVIKFWVKRFSLHKTKSEWMQGHYVDPKTIEKILEVKDKNKWNWPDPETENGGRYRARNWNPHLNGKPCFFCDKICNEIEIHHIDKNPFNNNPWNIIPTCINCHNLEHANVPFTANYDKLISIKLAEIDYAYDIEVKHEAHNFVANGFIVHNSLLDGMCKIPNIVFKAKEYGYRFLGCSDHGNVDGVIKFQKECLANNITPIIGCEVYLTKDMNVKEKGVKSYHGLLIVKNQVGWNNLLKMLTIANTIGFYYRPRIDYETLYQHNEGLIISTACSKSFILEDDGKECFLQIAKDRNYEDIYLELMPHKFEEQLYINDLCYNLHKKYDIPLLSTNDTHYVNKEDAESHEVLLAIQSKTVMNNPNRWKFNSDEYYFKTADEMIASFELQKQFKKSVYMEAMKNTLYLAQSCNFRIPKHEMSLPKVPGLENVDEDKYLRELVINGYYKRINDLIVDPVYEQRFEHELDIISRKGFTRYFLIVHDFVNWMRKNDFFMSPGRGSVGSSLVAYLIGITNVDSIKYNLPFSRFINEERIDYPDRFLYYPQK